MEKAMLIGLFFAMAAYLVTGGLVFYYLEADDNNSTFNMTAFIVENITSTFREKYPEIQAEELNDLVDTVILLYKEKTISKFTKSMHSSKDWDMFNSFYFATTIITTIGYGNLAPSTNWGKVFTVFYAIIGIPPCVLLLAGIGDKLHKSTEVLDDKISLCKAHPRLGKALRFTFISTIGGILVLCIPAVAFKFIEGWTYGEGVYFGAITLSTIGLGDKVAGTDVDLGPVWTKIYRVAMIAWIFMGLAWVSTTINFVKDNLGVALERGSIRMKELTTQLKMSKRVKEAEEPPPTATTPDLLEVEGERTREGDPRVISVGRRNLECEDYTNGRVV